MFGQWFLFVKTTSKFFTQQLGRYHCAQQGTRVKPLTILRHESLGSE